MNANKLQAKLIMIFFTATAMLNACHSSKNFPGYKLIERQFIKEINADCYLFEHIQSGARVMKIAADDPNKTFSIAFRMVPESDAGTAHILEHSVLNGSRNFPVRSPFDILMKGSLNTFLNAMTYDDFTVYPVASMNQADYFNLMHVYLDAVFNPLIYDEPRIFMQEGWHYELEDKSDPLIYKGVVYNEMKGAFSNPERELWYRIQKNLFPDNAYRFSSGGYPSAIPSLTYEDFVKFHKRNYHPSNSYIFLYGDADLEKELEFINREYLSLYTRQAPPALSTPQKKFDSMRNAHNWYAVLEDSPAEGQSYLALNWVIGSGADPVNMMALDLLADVLVNQESAPVRKALQKAGIGKDVYATSNMLPQALFSIVVQNASAADGERFREVVTSTLKEVCQTRIDKELLEGAVNRLEFRLREGNDEQKGLTYNIRSLFAWMETGDPFESLAWEKSLDRVREAFTEPWLENLIRKEMLDNSHALLQVLEPKSGLEKEIAATAMAELSASKKTMSSAQLDSLVKTTLDLFAFQQKEDSPEAIATIPLLKLSDINPLSTWYKAEETTVEGVPHLYFEEFTNQIVYLRFWFDLRVLPEEKLSYAALLAELLGKLDAGPYSYEQLDKALNIYTGGFSCNPAYSLPKNDDNELIPRMRVSLKATGGKLRKSLEILQAILRETSFDNRDRLLELIRRHQSQLELAKSQNGYPVAATRLSSYYLRRGVFQERTGGLDYYWFVTDLAKKMSQGDTSVIHELRQVYSLLFSRNNMLAGVTGSKADFKDYKRAFSSLADGIPEVPIKLHAWSLAPKPLNEGILTASKVQFVVQGFNYKKLGYTWNGHWAVLEQILSTDWLQKQIRVLGGAYGAWTSIGKDGTMSFASYRDPNLTETLNAFNGMVPYLQKFYADTTEMTRYIIGTIAGIDYPLTPMQKGDMAFKYCMEKIRREDLQQSRNEVLSVTAGDIRNISETVSRVLDQQALCVYGNSEKLRASEKLFRTLITLSK